MSSLPKLNIDNLLKVENGESLTSPVTPATEGKKTKPAKTEPAKTEPAKTELVEGEPEKKRRRVGGLPVSALVNEKNEETPISCSYPIAYLPPIQVDPVTPGRPRFPSILYQMSEFVTQLEDRSVNGTLPSITSLGLLSFEELAAGIVATKSLGVSSTKSAGDNPSRGKTSMLEPDRNHGDVGDENIEPSENGNNLSDNEPPREPKTLRRKRSRGERDRPVTTQPEIESLIRTLREQEKSRREEGNRDRASNSSQAEEEGEDRAPNRTRTRTTADGKSLSPTVSRSRGVTKQGTHRRGRPNGDNRPRPFSCPSCQRRFHQQSGVVSHYRVVHLREKRFECPHKCGLRFGARGDVTRHVDAVHNKIRNFECQVCGDAFARKSILTRHCKNMHNDIFGADEAHDCVHGCVFRPRNREDKEEEVEEEQK